MGLLTPLATRPVLGEVSVMRSSAGDATSVRDYRSVVATELGHFRREALGYAEVDASARRIEADSNHWAWRRDQRVAARIAGIEQGVLGIQQTSTDRAAPVAMSMRQLRGRDEIVAHMEAIEDAATVIHQSSPRWQVGADIGWPLLMTASIFLSEQLLPDRSVVSAESLGGSIIWGAFRLAALIDFRTMLSHGGLRRNMSRHYARLCDRIRVGTLAWDYSGKNFRSALGLAVGMDMAALRRQTILAIAGPAIQDLLEVLPPFRDDLGWLGVDRLLRPDPNTREPVLTVVVRSAPRLPQFPVKQPAALAERPLGRLRYRARAPARYSEWTRNFSGGLPIGSVR